jgi:hypothetical protein
MVEYRLGACPELESFAHLFPENSLVGEGETVPGIRNDEENDSTVPDDLCVVSTAAASVDTHHMLCSVPSGSSFPASLTVGRPMIELVVLLRIVGSHFFSLVGGDG